VELFDILDAAGRVIGVAPRSECHGNPELIHRAVHVLVFDADGRLYLQKRSSRKMIEPGKWDSSVGGHLESGESYETAAKRETTEELGFLPDNLIYLFSFEIRNRIESENINSYCTVFTGSIVPHPEEIDAGRFWSAEEIGDSLGGEIFTPSFEKEYELLSRCDNPVAARHFSCSKR